MADLHVVLVAPEIPWNTGNAGRTCLAVGAQLHLVAPLGFSLDEREVRRSGLDYWARVAPRVWPDWPSLERELPALGAPFFFASRRGRPFQAVRYPRPAVLVFGRESVGLPPEILDRPARQIVSIPMRDPALRSLNLSTSVGIAAYEVERQWASSEAGAGDLS
jgi:tRNA (cytidine/uridine-2'-O-)-methyltransferase